MGGFGGQSAQAPTLDIDSAKQLLAAQYGLQLHYLPKMSEAAGKASRKEYRENIDFGLGLLGDKGLAARYESALPQETARRIALLNSIDDADTTTPEFNRLQQSLGAGTPARTTNAVSMQAARMGPVRDVSGVNARRMADIRAQNVGAGTLGDSLMSQAIERAQSGGRLSAEASRDAVQAARAGMAARGMATGNAGLAAELLNRDRYARARQAEDNAFAAAVQTQDLQRQFNNVDSAMRADIANQQVGAQMSLSDQAAMMDAQRLNQARDLSIGQTDAQLAQDAAARNAASQNQASIFNAEMLAQNDRNNVAMLGQSAMLADQERARRLGLRQDAYNFAIGTNPNMMAIGMGSPYANLTQNAMGMVGSAQGLPQIYSGGQFSSGGGLGGAMGGIGAALGAGIGGVLAAPTGGLSVPMGMAIGGAFGGAAGGLGGSMFR